MTITYRAAIIGTGRIGSTYDDEIVNGEPATVFQGATRHSGLYTIQPVNHAAAYQTTPGFELVAAANRGEEKRRTFGERRGVRALYPDVRALMQAEQPDIVSVCTQSPAKAEITIAAAEGGAKAIIVEKAMATSMAEADAMLAACERHGVLLVVNHPNRFSPLNRRAKALIDTGAIGELGTVSAHARGGMLHIGTHTFDLLRYWAGDVVEVDARLGPAAAGADRAATGILRFASGVTGFFDQIHGVQPGFEARGTTGSVAVSASVGDGWLSRIAPMHPDSPRPYPTQISLEPIDPGPHEMSTLQRLLTELHASLTGGTPSVSTGRDGAAALELGIACHLSDQAGGPVTLPLADRAYRVDNR